MGRVLAAGTAVVCFVIAFVGYSIGGLGDRVMVGAVLLGLVLQALAILLHVSDPSRR